MTVPSNFIHNPTSEIQLVPIRGGQPKRAELISIDHNASLIFFDVIDSMNKPRVAFSFSTISTEGANYSCSLPGYPERIYLKLSDMEEKEHKQLDFVQFHAFLADARQS
jgi:hypothetical protein